ncbi:AAA family ATPase [Paenibacillus sp. L3-i20]|uniref:AAA family ATPase n=1 Tax=Paenibacillus sp. L3-i20 TaxID=2905833 RepID=UPI001EDF3267|nr:AAA family ATPase [Paenibacillus sp. L3-i20]GKU77209.1 hypothetical protein L3i20_v216060 [Paenibacillus sp. L3-i20]
MIINIDNKLETYMTIPPIALADFLELSVILTEMVCREHADEGMIEYFDLARIVVQMEQKVARLIRSIERHAAYQSPEQSGRLNRVADLRSDLYILGLILYELFTGRKPYDPSEGEGWNTAHIHMKPQSLSSVRPEGIGILEAIIMKLLAKSPDDRYQSAAGLLNDLMHCQDMLQRNGRLSQFEIGRLDQRRSLHLADLWVDRVSAMGQLQDGLELAGRGSTVFRWITGAKGIGKTSLVHKFQAAVVRQGGWFVEGSCGKSASNEPYGAFLQAMRQWLDQLWCEEPDVITRLKTRLQEEFYHHSSTIVSAWPEAKPLFECKGDSGDQKTYTDKGARPFGELLSSLVRCIAATTPPLILFMDDLDLADAETRALIHSLKREQALTGLFFIGACQSVEEWSTNPEEQIGITLLTSEEVKQFVSDALHEDSIRIRKLAQSIYEETGGNPGAIRYALEHWKKEKKIRFNEKNAQWVWDSELIGYKVDSEEAILQAEMSFAELPDTGKELLALAAAIGSIFQLSALSEISGLDIEQVTYWLQLAETEGLICFGENGADGSDMQEAVYLFPLDAAHQIAYNFDSECIPYRHRMIGKFLEQCGSECNWESSVSAIDHLNLAVAALSEQERMKLTEYNLQEGQRALSDGRFNNSRRYAMHGLALLEMQAKSQSTSLKLPFLSVLAWTEHMDGHLERARGQLTSLIEDNDSLSRVDRLQILTLLIRFHTIKDNDRAIQYGQEALTAYGWKLPKKGSLIAVVVEVLRTQLLLRWEKGRNKSFQKTDEEHAAFCGLLNYLMFPLLLHDARSLVALYARAIRYGVQNGMDEQLVGVRSVYELILQRVFPTIRFPSRTSTLAVTQYAGTIKSDNRYIISFMEGVLLQLEKPVATSPIIFKAMREGMEAGDKGFAYAALVISLVAYNGKLTGLIELHDYYKEHMQHNADSKIGELVEVAKRYISALQEEASLEKFISTFRDPSQTIPGHQEEDNYSCGCRLEVAYLAGRYREALYWAKLARVNELPLDWIRVRKQRVYEALSLASLYTHANETEQKRTRKVMRKLLRGMKRWQGFLGNQSSGHLLMGAEWERIAGNYTDALRGYTAAIEQAKAEESALMEGIVCERLAIYYGEKGMSRSGAVIAMMDACDAYAEWGAASIVARIRSQYADLLNPAVSRLGNLAAKGGLDDNSGALSNLPPQATRGGTDRPLDVPVNGDEYVPVQHIIEGVVKPDMTDWAVSLLEASIRQVGANRGFLLRCWEGNCLIEAGLDADIPHRETVSAPYAQSIIRWTMTTGEPLVLIDAVQGHWMKDTYVREELPRSILCMPIAVPIRQESYMLYLENRQMAGVFADRDLKVLELLAVRMIYHKLLAEETAATTEGIESESESWAKSTSVLTGDGELLTARETEVITAIAEGLSNREIAERLGIAETTVKTHTSRVISKLGVKRRGQAVVRARELGVIEE